MKNRPYQDYEDIFSKPWCPVFGESPGIGLPKHDKLAEIGGIIDEARAIIGVIASCAILDTNYPSVDQIAEEIEHLTNSLFLNNMTINDVLIVRDIFRQYRSVCQYVINDEQGVAIEGRPSHLFIKELLDVIDILIHTSGRYEVRDIPDQTILAIFAIKETYNAGRSLVIWDETPDLSKAYALLSAAKERVAEENKHAVISQLETAKPILKAREKRIRQLNDNNERKTAADEWHSIIGSWHDRIRGEERNRDSTNRKIAEIITKRVERKEFLESEIQDLIYLYETTKRNKGMALPRPEYLTKILSKIRPRRKK